MAYPLYDDEKSRARRQARAAEIEREAIKEGHLCRTWYYAGRLETGSHDAHSYAWHKWNYMGRNPIRFIRRAAA